MFEKVPMCSIDGRSKAIVQTLLAVLFLWTASPEPLAADELAFQGQVSFVSDYVFRGTSLSNENPAIQAGGEWSSERWTLSIWGSEVEFDPEVEAEIDLTVSWQWSFGDRVNGSLGVVRYNYVDNSSINYNDYFSSVQIGQFSLGFFWTPDFSGSDSYGTYLNFNYELQLSSAFQLNLHVGFSDFEDEIIFESYWDSSLRLTYRRGFFVFGLTGWITDLDGQALADNRIVGSAGFSF